MSIPWYEVHGADTGSSATRLLLVADRSGTELSEILGDTLRSVEGIIESYSDLRWQTARGEGEQPDLILVDLSLPDEAGFKICRDLYFHGVRAPILMWNRAKGDAAELASSVRLLLTRSLENRSAGSAGFIFGEVRVDFANGSVTRAGMPVKLSAKEFQLLRYLIAWRGTVLSRAELLDAVWRYRATTTRTLDVHISVLRQKLEECPHQPRHILTVRGSGYLFQASIAPGNAT